MDIRHCWSHAAIPSRSDTCLRVGAGIEQQPHTRRVTTLGGANQRRLSLLQSGVAIAINNAAELEPQHKNANKDLHETVMQ